jgi:hypothetical protein
MTLLRLAAVALGVVALGAVGALVAALVATLLGANPGDAPYFVVFILMPTSLGFVGFVLATRRPDNVVGWLLLVSGCLAGVAFAGSAYMRLAEAAGHLEWPLVTVGAWLANVWFVPSIGLLVVYLPLLFPTGRLLSPRWRVVAWIGVFGIAAGVLGKATAPGPLGDDGALPNPLVPPEPVLGIFQLASAASDVIAPVMFALAVASLLIRFRRSHDTERQQIKWLLFVATLSAASFGISLFDLPPISDAAWLAGLLSLGVLPIAIGLAILRYRLYDIDRIISRTISYAVVTALLGGAYLAAFVGLEAVFAPVTASGGSVAVAASTLVVFALFSPVRRRISTFVDRRFNRSRYDAELTVRRLAGRLRDETDLEALTREVEAVVGAALSPAIVGVWTRQQ